MTEHSITPPSELVQQWMSEFYGSPTVPGELALLIATRAAQLGADQELEACIAWFDKHIPGYELVADRLRTARRPKPKSLKEQAWKLLECYGTSGVKLTADQCNTIRKALEDSND